MITRDLIQLGSAIIALIIVVVVAGRIEDSFEETASTRIDITILGSIYLVAGISVFAVVKIVMIFSYLLSVLRG